MVDQKLDRVFHALADTTRRRILKRLVSKERTVGELAAPFAMSLEAVSKHIRVLEEARLVRRTRSGRVHHLRMRPKPLHEAAALMAKLAGHWERRLEALEQLLSEHEE